MYTQADLEPQDLHKFIVRFFNLEELRDLCFYLGVDYDSLPGEGKSAKARELVTYMGRTLRLDELQNNLANLRPKAFAEFKLARGSYEESPQTYSKRDLSGKGDTGMITPEQQLGIGILLEATNFLFVELGRRLEFWRNNKGGNNNPKIIESEERSNGVVVKLDDLEQLIKVEELQNQQEDIQACLKRIKTLKRRLRIYEDQETRPLRPEDVEVVQFNVQELRERIEEEGDRLQNMLELVYGD